MKRGSLKFLVLALVAAMVGLLQSTELFAWHGVKLNIVLAFLVSASFFVRSFRSYALLVIVGMLALRFSHLFARELVVLALLLMISFIVSARLPGRPFINNLFLIAVTTSFFYALLDRESFRKMPDVILIESLYNMGAGMVLFGLGKLWYIREYEEKLKTRI